MLLERYDEGRLLAYAKGWTLDGIAEEVLEQIQKKKRPELAEFDLSAATLQRRSVTSRHIPKPLAELIEELKAQQGREHLTEIVESGLRVLRGETATSKTKAQELALAVLASFPTDELALKLADALAKQAGLSSGTGSLLDIFAQAIAGRLPRVPEMRETKLASRLAKRLDRLSVKRLAFAGAAGGAVACLVWLVFTALWGHASTTAPPPASPGVTAKTGVGQGAAELDVKERCAEASCMPVLGSEGSGEMGKKEPSEKWIPPEPLEGQKRPPCDEGLAQEALSGGCWGRMDVKPPCGRLYRKADSCYAPIAADPKRPVGGEPRPVVPERQSQ